MKWALSLTTAFTRSFVVHHGHPHFYTKAHAEYFLISSIVNNDTTVSIQLHIYVVRHVTRQRVMFMASIQPNTLIKSMHMSKWNNSTEMHQMQLHKQPFMQVPTECIHGKNKTYLSVKLIYVDDQIQLVKHQTIISLM
jgi:hypothetical protein